MNTFENSFILSADEIKDYSKKKKAVIPVDKVNLSPIANTVTAINFPESKDSGLPGALIEKAVMNNDRNNMAGSDHELMELKSSRTSNSVCLLSISECFDRSLYPQYDSNNSYHPILRGIEHIKPENRFEVTDDEILFIIDDIVAGKMNLKVFYDRVFEKCLRLLFIKYDFNTTQEIYFYQQFIPYNKFLTLLKTDPKFLEIKVRIGKCFECSINIKQKNLDKLFTLCYYGACSSNFKLQIKKKEDKMKGTVGTFLERKEIVKYVANQVWKKDSLKNDEKVSDRVFALQLIEVAKEKGWKLGTRKDDIKVSTVIDIFTKLRKNYIYLSNGKVKSVKPVKESKEIVVKPNNAEIVPTVTQNSEVLNEKLFDPEFLKMLDPVTTSILVMSAREQFEGMAIYTNTLKKLEAA